MLQLMILRKNRRLSQKELGRRIGVSNVKISRFENGQEIPRADVLKKLAIELDTTMDILMEEFGRN